MLRRALCTVGLVAMSPLWAGGLESLDGFIKSTRSGRATFVQTVTAPPKNGQAARPKVSIGTFRFCGPTASALFTKSRLNRPWLLTDKPCGCMTWTWRR
jgi:hypothetical protein